MTNIIPATLTDVLTYHNVPLHPDQFEEKSPGRFFGRRELLPFNPKWEIFPVVLLPNAESPVHKHDDIIETHILLGGSGYFMYWNSNNERPEGTIYLEKGQPHRIFTSPEHPLLHKFVAGPYGSVTRAFERKYESNKNLNELVELYAYYQDNKRADFSS